jgi:hypothetical protein
MFVGGEASSSLPAQEFDHALSSLLGSMDKRVWVGIRLCPHQSDLVTSADDQMIQLWPWLLVITGYFYGIIPSINGVISTYKWYFGQ